MRAEDRSERHKEYLRKGIHIGFGILILLLIHFTGTSTSAFVLGFCLAIGVLFAVGIKCGMTFPILNHLVKQAERENEKHFPGKAAIFFFISAIVLLLIFKDSPNIVLAALSVQVFADSFAAIIGKKFGKTRLFRKKSLEGSATCLIVSIICISFFQPLSVAIIAGTIATLVELLPIDDNLWVPIITGITIKILL